MIVTMSAEKPRAATSKLVNTRFIGRPNATPTATSSGATNSAIWVLEPRAMVSARSVCPRWAATTAVACSAADQEQVAEDRPRERRLHEVEQPGAERHDRHDQLRGIAEGGVEEAAQGGPGAPGEALGRLTHLGCQGDDREAGDEEDGERRGREPGQDPRPGDGEQQPAHGGHAQNSIVTRTKAAPGTTVVSSVVERPAASARRLEIRASIAEST